MSVEEAREGPTYEELHIIGKGAYGMVYKARDRKNKKFVALKKVRMPLNDDGVPMNTLREITLLKQLEFHNHPNIVKLLDICHGQRTEKELIMYLVFEHVEQDLASFISQYSNSSFKHLTSWQIRNICKEILEGVDFLHSLRIVHRDLKPQNILITENGQIKLADFGLAKTYDFEMRLTSVVVTLWYRSPEVLLSLSYATPVDIWSIGCIMAELYMLKPLFCGNSEGDQLYQIFQVLGKPPESEWPEGSNIKYNSFEINKENDVKTRIPNLCENGFDLLMRMLAFDPDKRISAEKALQHIYFQEEPLDT